MFSRQVVIVSLLTCAVALPQTKSAPASVANTRKPAQSEAAVPSPVQTIIELYKGGTPEAIIIKTLRAQNNPAKLTTADLVALHKGGVPDSIVEIMLDPSASVVPAQPVTPQTSPAVQAVPVTVKATPQVTRSAPSSACPLPANIPHVSVNGKRRIVVDPFDYSAVRSQVTAMFNNDLNIGEGIRAMLSVKMDQSKTATLLERKNIKVIEGEQDYGASNRTDQGTKARIGKIKGADAILLGDIVIFGRDTRTTTVHAGGAAVALCKFSIWGCAAAGQVNPGMKSEKAVVAINLRLVDAETTEILATAEARGESSRKSTDWSAMAGTWQGTVTAGKSMNSSDFRETIIGEATADAVAQIAGFIDQKIPEIASRSRSVEGRVTNIDGCRLYLNVTGKDSVQVGDRFEIDQITEQVIDPETKEVLGQESAKVGEFVVSELRDKFSIGQYGGQTLSQEQLGGRGYAARLMDVK